MRELSMLISINFKQMLHTFSMGKGSASKKMGALGGLALMAGLALYLSGIYSWLMGQLLMDAGVIEFLLPVMSLLAVAVSLMFTFFAASGIVFGGRDMDFMLSMPVSSYSVMLAKMSALYLENLVFTGLWMIPTGIAGYQFGVAADAGYFIRLLFVIVFLPFLPSLLASLGGYVIAWAGARVRHKALATNLISVVLLVVLLLGCMQINSIGALLLTYKEEAQRLFMTWLLPIGLLGKGMSGSWFALLGCVLSCLLPFLFITWVFSLKYKQILTSLKARTLRSDYRLTGIKSDGQFSALLKKEINRLFSTSSMLMNCCIGLVMLLAFAVYLLVAKEQMAMLAQLFGPEGLAPMFLVCMAGLLSMVYPSSVSISLEGKTLWVLKEAPISMSTLFGAKAALNLVLTWPVALIATIAFMVIGDLTLLTGLAMLILCLALTLFNAVAGIAVNLHFPKMDCDNDTIIVKQSASAMIGCFGGLLLIAAGAGIWAVTRSIFAFEVYCALMTAIFLAASFVIWKYLTTKGAEILTAL